jgi:hypothetical protein
VQIYDAERGRQLLAAIELVSPGNKHRPEKRNAFVGKCAAPLQKGVAVSIADVVTVRQFNLYASCILVDAARRKQALKRGGNGKQVALDPDRLAAPAGDTDQ